RGKNQGVEHWIPPSAGILRTSNWTDMLASASLAPLGLPFDSPKSVALLQALLRLCGDEESLVLDFFAGSGTTGHAVLALNREDGGRRRFILAQLAEPTDDPRYPTIAAIARARLRQVIADLQAQPTRHATTSAPAEDLGFRALRITETEAEQEAE
nr:site-specific DNA-methyltransferase [Ktedonobacterales bacterium]